jgi:hypothetical protein
MTYEELLAPKSKDPDYEISSPKIQLLPCKVHHTGSALVSAYLINQDQTSTLRGRGLLGEKIRLEEHEFVLLQKQDNRWRIKGKSDELLVWAHDQIPSILNTPIMYINPWVELSSEIHKKT